MPRILLLIFITLLCYWPSSWAKDFTTLASQVKEIELSNGMRWLILYRPQIPVFSGSVVLRVGGAEEEEGKTGLAHMFEHMAFKGTKEIGTRNFAQERPLLEAIASLGRKMAEASLKENPDPNQVSELRSQIETLDAQAQTFRSKNEIWETLTRRGAVDLNAFTSKDMTGYHASLPKNQFPLWAYLFSEMIFQPVMREFYAERDVVMEERRLRYDNSPEGHMLEALLTTAFPTGSYHTPPIGKYRDLTGLTMEDAYQFHERFYLPQKMVGVLVGAISLSQAKPILEKFFGRFQSEKRSQEPAAHSFALQGEKRNKISFPAEPSLAIAFHKPNAPAREDYVFDVIEGLLCEGRTGRLYRHLVEEKKLVSQVYCSAGFPGSRFENLFLIFLSPNKNRSLPKIEKEVMKVLAAMQQGVQPGELKKVLAAVLYDYYWGLEDNLGIAEQLAATEASLGDWNYLVNYPKVLETIGLEEVQAVAKKYLVPENRIVIQRVRGKR